MNPFEKGVAIVFFLVFFSLCSLSAQELSISDTTILNKSDTTLSDKDLSEVVVTATRSDRKLNDVPIPVAVIGRDQIQSSGASRLDEILSEQTGLAIIYDHGLGIQVQGMDSEYTLIMINGEPVVGRTAGTLDLDRITVSNIKRIEVIKGPASSIYGSDALGGVINIITDDYKAKGLSFQSQFGSNITSDNTLNASTALGKKGNTFLSLNRYQTHGYNLRPESNAGKTVEPFTSYSLRAGIKYRFTPKLTVDLNGQYFTESQKNDYRAIPDKDTVHIRGKGKESDLQFSPIVTYYISSKWNLKLRNYWSQYQTQNNRTDADADTVFENSSYTETLWKEELQSEYLFSKDQILTLGLGYQNQSVKASYYDAIEHLKNLYLYAQHEWHPTKDWNILTGFRYDHPSAYRSQFSPKIAAQYKLTPHLSLQASTGVGYKAPNLSQLYLDFSNPTVGYSALGVKVIKRGLEKMQEEGLIDRLFVKPSDAALDLKPESSLAYNLRLNYEGNSGWSLSGNLFRNDIKDMIDTYVVALKTNGQSFFGYHNIHKVFTQGLELEGVLPLFNHHLILRGGYSYLLAKNKEVVNEIKNGEKFKKNEETGQVEKIKLSDYGGLFNRSKHSFNLKVYYSLKSWFVNTRLIYRGKYGFGDLNGNTILDSEKEYAPSYALVHLNVGRSFWSDRISTQLGIKDLFNHKDAQYLPYISGRTWYLRATFHIF